MQGSRTVKVKLRCQTGIQLACLCGSVFKWVEIPQKGGRVLLLVRKERNHAHVVTLQTPGLGLHMFCTVS